MSDKKNGSSFILGPSFNRRVLSPYYSHFPSSTILVVIAWAKNRRRSEFPLTALKVVLQFPHDNGHWREHAHRFLYTSAIKGQCAIQHSCKQDVRIPTSSQNSITSRVNDRRKKIHLSEFWIAHLSKYGMLLRSSLVNSLSASPLNTSATSLAAISCCSGEHARHHTVHASPEAVVSWPEAGLFSESILPIAHKHRSQLTLEHERLHFIFEVLDREAILAALEFSILKVLADRGQQLHQRWKRLVRVEVVQSAKSKSVLPLTCKRSMSRKARLFCSTSPFSRATRRSSITYKSNDDDIIDTQNE